MKGFGINWITPQGDPQFIFTILASIAIGVAALVFASFYYRRWQKRRRFVEADL